jgi:hypothetical protein
MANILRSQKVRNVLVCEFAISQDQMHRLNELYDSGKIDYIADGHLRFRTPEELESFLASESHG